MIDCSATTSPEQIEIQTTLLRLVVELSYNKNLQQIYKIESCTTSPQQIYSISTCRDIVQQNDAFNKSAEIHNKSKQCSFGFDLLRTCYSAAANHKTNHSNEPTNRTYDVRYLHTFVL